ncbi:ATP-binding protein [Mesorhizobium sp. KR9-304]|uniref:ATP-binding protein n=1 Tax=Mesorhizobium sp. KR9-304 TaxID=3156614 RepID=UPI0032B5AEAC
MADTRREERTRRLLSLAAGRLAHNRWMLAAGAAAVIAVGLAAGVSASLAAAALLFLLVVALLAPRRTRRERQADRAAASETGRLDGLSAQSLAEAVGDPLIIFDTAGVAVHVNDAARSAFGPLAPGLSLLMKFRAPEIQPAIERVRTGAAVSEVVDYVERVPIERVYKVTVSAIGRGTGLFVMVFKDQSEARRIDRMRADFIANASHELRTPLASISGFVETLRGPARNDAAARDHFLQIMQNQTARMARLIDDLLSLSRLEMKPYLPPGASVDVREIVQSVIDSLSPLARESGVVIERAFGDDPIQAHGDRDELFQVFENLLENACKYGQSGGRVVVSIERANALDPEIAVTIRDFGLGIPEEHIPRITERFYRADVDNSRAQKGTGLGLSIVKHILTRHNARLAIKSTVGEGASFTVHLPVKRGDQ